MFITEILPPSSSDLSDTEAATFFGNPYEADQSENCFDLIWP